MHELSLVESLVSQVRQHAGEQRVKTITVTVGVMTCVDPDAMQFCFEACREQAGLADTELMLVRQEASGECRDCGARFAIWQAIQPCACGSMNVAVSGGDAMLLTELAFE